MKTIRKKISSQRGESIGETLIALLISSLALIMLAGAVSSAMRIVTNSKEKMDAYYKVNNAVAARATTVAIDGETVEGFTGTLTVSIDSLLPPGKMMPGVNCWKNEQLSSIPVIAYSKSSA